MNAPQFLRRKREPLSHPVDLDGLANAVDMYAKRVKQNKTEAMVVADMAEQAVLRATQITKEVMAVVDKAKAIAAEIESAGLRLIGEVQKQQDEFNRRTENFIASASTLHDGLRDVLAKVGGDAPQQTLEAEPKPAAEMEADIADVVHNKATAQPS